MVVSHVDVNNTSINLSYNQIVRTLNEQVQEVIVDTNKYIDSICKFGNKLYYNYISYQYVYKAAIIYLRIVSSLLAKMGYKTEMQNQFIKYSVPLSILEADGDITDTVRYSVVSSFESTRFDKSTIDNQSVTNPGPKDYNVLVTKFNHASSELEGLMERVLASVSQYSNQINKQILRIQDFNDSLPAYIKLCRVLNSMLNKAGAANGVKISTDNTCEYESCEYSLYSL